MTEHRIKIHECKNTQYDMYDYYLVIKDGNLYVEVNNVRISNIRLIFFEPQTVISSGKYIISADKKIVNWYRLQILYDNDHIKAEKLLSTKDKNFYLEQYLNVSDDVLDFLKKYFVDGDKV